MRPGIAEPTLRPQSGSELQRVMEAEREGVPFLIWRDGSGAQQLMALESALERATIGRRPANDVVLGWDSQVSRTHALLQFIAGEWAVSDEGLSANGTYVNDERIGGRRRLRDGDLIRAGETLLSFRDPTAAGGTTSIASGGAEIAELSRLQRQVLLALCRPYLDGQGVVAPASNRQIAAEVHLSIDAVKSHLGKMFTKFGIGELPQNEKRTRLVELSFRFGLVTERDR